ncbi:MAG: ABC transporter permease [Fimbriimonadales bacterium]|nr:ABC transporter permease [Fimbriimonadales bacterium]
MTLLEIALWQIWEHTQPRRLLGLGTIALVGPFLGLIWRLADPRMNPEAVYGVLAPLAVYGLSLVLLCLVLAGGVVSQEVTNGTIGYLLTRPLSRTKLILGKWLGSWAVASVLVILADFLTALIVLGGNSLNSSQLLREVFAILLGCAAYCSAFAALSTLMTKPWVVAVSYAFFWESWVPLMPGDFRKLSLMAQVRALARHDAPIPKRESEILRMLWGEPEQISALSAFNTLALVVVLALTVACLVFTTSQYIPKEETT